MKSGVIDWKRHPVTQELFAALQERISGVKEEIAVSAHDADPRTLAFKSGYIQALRDILNLDVFEESHGS